MHVIKSFVKFVATVSICLPVTNLSDCARVKDSERFAAGFQARQMPPYTHLSVRFLIECLSDRVRRAQVGKRLFKDD